MNEQGQERKGGWGIPPTESFGFDNLCVYPERPVTRWFRSAFKPHCVHYYDVLGPISSLALSLPWYIET